MMPVSHPHAVPPSRAVVIRGGGLGDFVLVLPWLRALRRGGTQVTLVTRPAYHALIAGDDLADATLALDGADFGSLTHRPTARLRAALAGATVYSVAPDPAGTVATAVQAAGATAYVQLTARPTAPPHFTTRLFRDSGLEPPPDLLTRAVLAPEPATFPARGGALWLHLGSGSATKNVPLPTLRRWAAAWLDAGGQELVLSAGEADTALVAPARVQFAGLPVRWVLAPELPELRAGLATAAAYVGADTGVTHLAAALGRPTVALFQVTDPAIWRPLGPRVTVAGVNTPPDAACWAPA